MAGRTRGFTLIELLIAMVVGLVVGGAALALITDSLQSARMAGEVQKHQRNLTATADFLWPRLRQASSVANDDDHGTSAIRIKRRTSRGYKGVDCTGVSIDKGTSVTEVYFTTEDATLRCRADDEREASVAFGVESIALNRVMTDTNQDGRVDAMHDDPPFPSGVDVVGVEISIEKQWLSDESRTIPLTAALRNGVLTRRSREGDDD